MHRKKYKNKTVKGFTLIELVVSIVILAIVVLPILTAFVISARTNTKAKDEHCATNVAENIMEGLEKETLADVKAEFSGTSFSLFPVNSDDYCELTYDDASSTYAKANVSTDDGHKHYFYVADVKNDDRSYSALITIDARTDDDNSIYEKYNKDMAVVDMSALDTKYDGVCSKSENTAEILNSINSLYNLSTPLTTNDLSQITRTIHITISRDSVTNLTLVKVAYKYSFRNSSGVEITFPESGSAYEDTYTVIAYDNSSDKSCELKNIYLLYKPWYTSVKNFPYCTDKIIVDNDDGVKCNLKIIKQNSETTNASNLEILEKNYRAAVYVNDPGVNKSNVSVATNLGINLAVEYNSEHPELSAVPNQATYIYNNTNANQNKVKEILSITGFNEQVTKDRLMDVTVDVYPKGTKISELNTQKPVVTMTGGMTN